MISTLAVLDQQSTHFIEAETIEPRCRFHRRHGLQNR